MNTDPLNPCETLGRGSFGTQCGLTFAHVWLGTQGKAELGQRQGAFGIHLERGPGADLLASLGGRREAEGASFSPGSMDQLATRVKGCTSESFLELLQRGWRTRGLNWPLAGQAPGGAGARGPWRVGRGRMEPRALVGAPPARPPSWRRSELWLRGCFAASWAGWRSSPLPCHRPQCYTRGLGASEVHFLSPCERLRGRDPSRCAFQPARHLLPYSFSHQRNLFSCNLVPNQPRTGLSYPLVTQGTPSWDVTPSLLFPAYRPLSLLGKWVGRPYTFRGLLISGA